MTKLEVLPVPPEMVSRVWKPVRRVLAKIPHYDIERTYARLRVGVDQLWVSYAADRLAGVVITSISNRPPKRRRCFWRNDAALMKSLTIHVAGEHALLSWLDSAIERINRYAREHRVHQLFLMARKGYQRHLIRRWWSSEWEMVAFSRDRPTKSTCWQYRERNKPGYFRPLVPVPKEKFSRHRYRIVGVAEFPMEAA